MKLSNHESDAMAAARLGPPAANDIPAYRESWLDKIARHLAVAPIDHMPIVPRGTAPAPACCATAGRR